MFSRRKNLDRRRRYTREFIESLSLKLKDAGFNKITVILPHNYPSVDPKKSEVSLSDFLNRERNYSAVIYKAYSTSSKEILKILFINSNRRAVFADDTFPMAESEPSGMFFQSPDPARAFAVFEYFYELLTIQSIWKYIVFTISSMISILLILSETLMLFYRKIGLLSVQFHISPLFDLLLFLLASIIIFKFTATPTGLWIKPKRELKLIYLTNMVLKGQFKDNPIVQLTITIIGGIIVGLFLKLLGMF